MVEKPQELDEDGESEKGIMLFRDALVKDLFKEGADN